MQPKRVEILTQIASRYHELVDPLNGPDRVRGDGESLALMPKTYTATVKEFERLMALMRNQGKQKAYAGYSLGKLRWHVLHWFVEAQPVIRSRPLLVSAPGGKFVQAREQDGSTAMIRTTAYLRNPDAREDRALLGIGWMAENWALRHEPFLPDELLAYKEAA